MLWTSHLTRSQAASVAEYVEKWTGFGLSTTPADRPRAEAGLRHAYRAANLPEPERIVWCGGPLSAAIAAAVVLNIPNLFKGNLSTVANQISSVTDTSIFTLIRESASDRVCRYVEREVQKPVEAVVEGAVKAPLTRFFDEAAENMLVGPIREAVWPAARRCVEHSLSPSDWVWIKGLAWSGIRTLVSDTLKACLYGQHDAAMMAYLDFFCKVVFHDDPRFEPMDGLLEVAQSAGWFLPQRKVCWISERPNALHLDLQGRFHCEDGPALAYPDGFKVYLWHGVRTPAAVIEHPDSITVDQIEAEANVEVRRVMLERFGEARFIEESSTLLHTDETGMLYRRVLPRGEPVVMVKVINSTLEPDGTRRVYFLRVPPDMQTAHQAIAWTFGLRPDEYQPLVET